MISRSTGRMWLPLLLAATLASLSAASSSRFDRGCSGSYRPVVRVLVCNLQLNWIDLLVEALLLRRPKSELISTCAQIVMHSHAFFSLAYVRLRGQGGVASVIQKLDLRRLCRMCLPLGRNVFCSNMFVSAPAR